MMANLHDTLFRGNKTHHLAMKTCAICGSAVTVRFARVFGDNDDEVAGCLECATWQELTEGRPG